MSGPIEVLIKTKWYRANAAISEHYLGICLDEEQPDGLWQVHDFFVGYMVKNYFGGKFDFP